MVTLLYIIKLCKTMEIYKQCKVILLPTKNTDTILTLYRNNNELSLNNDRLEYHTNQYLYIVSNDEIKIGDYFILFTSLYGYIVKKCKTIKENIIYCNDGEILDIDFFNIQKIIATTDKLLLIPTIPKIYLERYIKLYNLGIEESNVSVEYIKEKLNITKNNEIIIL